MKLRPHHVLGYCEYLKYLLDSEREKDYLKHWKRIRGDSHSDGLVLHWEATLKKLQRNAKFEYVSGLDSVCEECEHVKKCHDPGHDYFKRVKRWDDHAKQNLSELEFGKTYDGKFLKEMFEKKNWLKTSKGLLKKEKNT